MITRTVVGRTFTYSHAVGRVAPNGMGFFHPTDVSLAQSGNAYVVNSNLNHIPSTRVGKLTLGDEVTSPEYILEFGQQGTDDGQFVRPCSLAVDSDESVYVADQWLNRVSIFSSQGEFSGKWGIYGSTDGELNRPWGMTFDLEGNLLIVDAGNNRVQRFTRDGKFLENWGRQGTGEGEFNIPWGITTDRDGNVYVADWRNSRTQKFTADGSYLMSFGTPGSGMGELYRPSGVAVDSEGDVYVVDWGRHKVNVYSSEGVYLTAFTGDARQLPVWAFEVVAANPDVIKARNRAKKPELEWDFFYPTGIDIDDQRRIVVTDQQRHRLQVYIKEKDYVEPQFNL